MAQAVGSGKFYFNRKYADGAIDIRGENVRLRSQPNTQSRIIAEVREDMCLDGTFIYYLGEWTNPKSERWGLADYEGFKNGKRTPVQPVWIFGRYTELGIQKEFEDRINAETE